MKSRRRFFRFLAYAFLAILFVFLLILYYLYLSAQRKPEFYKEALSIPVEMQRLRNEETVRKQKKWSGDILKLNRPWQLTLTSDDINASLAIGDAARRIPREMTEPRISFQNDRCDFACRIDQGSVSCVLNLVFEMKTPETNKLELRILKAQVGTLAISKELPAKMIAETLTKQGIDVRLEMEEKNPLLTIRFDLNKDRKNLQIKNVEIRDNAIHLSGNTIVAPPKKSKAQ